MKLTYFNSDNQMRVWNGDLKAFRALPPADRAKLLTALKKSRNDAWVKYFRQRKAVDVARGTSKDDELKEALRVTKKRVATLKAMLNNKEIPECVMEAALRDLGVSKACAKEGEEEAYACPICKDPMEIGEAAMTSTCGHFFHETCIVAHLEGEEGQDKECPTCHGHVDINKIYTLDDDGVACTERIAELATKPAEVRIRTVTIAPRARSKRIAECESSRRPYKKQKVQ